MIAYMICFWGKLNLVQLKFGLVNFYAAKHISGNGENSSGMFHVYNFIPSEQKNYKE